MFVLSFLALAAVAQAQDEGVMRTYQVNHQPKSNTPLTPPDSIKLQIENTNAYYQKTFAVDSSIKVSLIYLRALQFMAAKNFQQNYGYEQEGKMIFTTTQDLNKNTTASDNDDNPETYTVQFAITIDMKNGRYRCTISNVTFYLPRDSGNRRMTLFDVYLKEAGAEPKRVQKDAKGLIDSFEKYLITLTNDLNAEIEHKAAIYNSKY
jgi:hypothetical protein